MSGNYDGVRDGWYLKALSKSPYRDDNRDRKRSTTDSVNIRGKFNKKKHLEAGRKRVWQTGSELKKENESVKDTGAGTSTTVKSPYGTGEVANGTGSTDVGFDNMHLWYQNYSGHSHNAFNVSSYTANNSRGPFSNESASTMQFPASNFPQNTTYDNAGYPTQSAQYQQNYFDPAQVSGYGVQYAWTPTSSNVYGNYQIATAIVNPSVNMGYTKNCQTSESMEKQQFPQSFLKIAPPFPPPMPALPLPVPKPPPPVATPPPTPVPPPSVATPPPTPVPPPPVATPPPTPVPPPPVATPPLSLESLVGNSSCSTSFLDAYTKPLVFIGKSEQEDVPPPAPPKILIRKRRGGKALPTGIIRKPNRNPSTSTQKADDIATKYKEEVSRYKSKMCSDDTPSTRPLVK